MIFKLPIDLKELGKYICEYTGIIEVIKKRPQRSGQQNKYLHVIIALFAIETGYTLEEMKQVLKARCSFMVYMKDSELFYRSSASLDSKQLSDWIEWIRNYAGIQGINLPSAEDYGRDWVAIERTIEKARTWI